MDPRERISREEEGSRTASGILTFKIQWRKRILQKEVVGKDQVRGKSTKCGVVEEKSGARQEGEAIQKLQESGSYEHSTDWLCPQSSLMATALWWNVDWRVLKENKNNSGCFQQRHTGLASLAASCFSGMAPDLLGLVTTEPGDVCLWL